MNTQRLAGLILLVGGIVLFVVGMNASDSIADRWTNFFTGHFTNETVLYMVGGGIAAAVGLSMMALGFRAPAAR
ncbi:MAG: DUF3185 family protein [Planctomycetota bacterium]|nr:DUF3185 family protein [Planctomycetota bacterium]